METFTCGPIATNAYLIGNILIDPAPGSFEQISSEVKLILLTHSHWDHIADCARFDVPVLVHSLDAENLRKPGSDGLPRFMEIEGVEPSQMLKDGDEIEGFKVIHTPGHSPGHCCFYCEETSSLFSGDLLFKGGIGRIDFPTAEPELMWPSLDRVAELPPETTVYPGHGPPTTIGEESHGSLSWKERPLFPQ